MKTKFVLGCLIGLIAVGALAARVTQYRAHPARPRLMSLLKQTYTEAAVVYSPARKVVEQVIDVTDRAPEAITELRHTLPPDETVVCAPLAPIVVFPLAETMGLQPLACLMPSTRDVFGYALSHAEPALNVNALCNGGSEDYKQYLLLVGTPLRNVLADESQQRGYTGDAPIHNDDMPALLATVEQRIEQEYDVGRVQCAPLLDP